MAITQSDNILPGYAQHIEINETPFKNVGCQYQIRKSVFQNRDDGDGPFHKSLIDGLQLTASVNFQTGTNNNPHVAPYYVMDFATERIYLKIFPRGWRWQPYIIPEFTVTEYSGNANPQQGPCGGSFSGENYGKFYTPTDAPSTLMPLEGEEDPEPYVSADYPDYYGN